MLPCECHERWECCLASVVRGGNVAFVRGIDTD